MFVVQWRGISTWVKYSMRSGTVGCEDGYELRTTSRDHWGIRTYATVNTTSVDHKEDSGVGHFLLNVSARKMLLTPILALTLILLLVVARRKRLRGGHAGENARITNKQLG